jgi:hypothetical protein
MSRTVTPQENASKAGNDNGLRDHTQSADPPRAAEWAAFPANDAELGQVIEAWPGLPEAVRAGTVQFRRVPRPIAMGSLLPVLVV